MTQPQSPTITCHQTKILNSHSLPAIKFEAQENVLPALENYDSKDTSRAALPSLQNILLQATKTVNSQLPPEQWFLVLFFSEFRCPNDRNVNGSRILTNYAISQYREENPTNRSNDKTILANLERTVGGTYRDFLRTVLNCEVSEPRIPSKDNVYVVEAPAFNFQTLSENQPSQFENLLREIILRQFSGDPLEVTYHDFATSSYGHLNTSPTTGLNILKAYSLIQFRFQFPRSKISTARILRTPGFKPVDILHAVRKDVVREIRLRPTLADVLLEESFQLESLSRLNTDEIEGILKFIHSSRFLDRNGTFELSALILLNLRDTAGNFCSMHDLLIRYSCARFEKHFPNSRKSKEEIIAISGYSVKDSHQAFLATLSENSARAISLIPFKRFSSEELKRFIEEQRLGSLMNALGDNPAVLAEGLSLFREKSFAGRSIAEFIERYVGLDGIRYTNPSSAVNHSNELVAAVMALVELGDDVPFAQVQFERALKLFIRTARRDFDELQGKLIRHLLDESVRILTDPKLGGSKEAALFLSSIYRHAAEYFQHNALQVQEVRMKSKPFSYQLEGAEFLARRQRAILDDDPGLGKTRQALSAALRILLRADRPGERKALFLTTAANRENIAEELRIHTDLLDNEYAIISSDSPKKRKSQVEHLHNELFLISNYETLVSIRRSTPALYARLIGQLDIVILDEAQLTDNELSLRTKAVRGLESVPYMWGLTATLYQHRLERIRGLLGTLFPASSLYQNGNAFRELFLRTTDGLSELRTKVLDDLVLRRTKEETVRLFDNSGKKSIVQQLKGGQAMLAEKVYHEPKQRGFYYLTPEQEYATRWIISDFKDWAYDYNSKLSDQQRAIDLSRINALLKFDWISKIIYQPHLAGLSINNPLYPTLDSEIRFWVAQGKKVILWAWNTEVIYTLSTRYQNFNAVTIDGMSTRKKLTHTSRHLFQNDPSVRVAVVNRESGGVGLTLTAADVSIMVQPPVTFPPLYQIEGRNHRIISSLNQKHAKSQIHYVWMTPMFTPDFINSVEDHELRTILDRGTLVQQTYRRLQGGRTLYHLVHDGFGSSEELEQNLQASLLEGMGLKKRPSSYPEQSFRQRTSKTIHLAKKSKRLWQNFAGDLTAQSELLELIENGCSYDKQTGKVIEALSEYEDVGAPEISALNALFQLDNRYLVSEVLQVLRKNIFHLRRADFRSKLAKLPPNPKLIDVFPLFLDGHCAETPFFSDALLSYIQKERDHPKSRRLSEYLVVGALGVLSNSTAQRLWKQLSTKFEIAPWEERISVLFSLGLLARFNPDSLEGLCEIEEAELNEFHQRVESEIVKSLAEFLDTDSFQLQKVLRSFENTIAPRLILAYLVGWESVDNSIAIEQFRVIFRSLIDETYRNQRYGRGFPNPCLQVTYLSSASSFWKSFAENSTCFAEAKISAKQFCGSSVLRNFRALERGVGLEMVSVEGPTTLQMIDKWKRMKGAAKIEFKQRLHHESGVLGHILGRINDERLTLSSPERKIVHSYGLSRRSKGGNQLFKLKVQQVKKSLESVICWTSLLEEFDYFSSEGRFQSPALVIDSLTRISSRYRSANTAPLSELAKTLRSAIKELVKTSSNDFEETRLPVTIEETDDPGTILQMGALSPGMANCFNPCGDPRFTQFVLSALGSKNFKLVLVRDQDGQILAAAPLKVRKDNEESPILFLERGLSVHSYDFQTEMLTLVALKTRKLREVYPQVRASYQNDGSLKHQDISVHGTGACTRDEYAEAVFHPRNAFSVSHRARLLEINNVVGPQ